jgi:hypothetical protein
MSFFTRSKLVSLPDVDCFLYLIWIGIFCVLCCVLCCFIILCHGTFLCVMVVFLCVTVFFCFIVLFIVIYSFVFFLLRMGI